MKSFEYELKKPEIEELDPLLKNKLEEFLSVSVDEQIAEKDMGSIASLTNFEITYEQQQEDYQPFQKNKIWHTDGQGLPNRNKVFHTASPAIYAHGKLILHNTLEPLADRLVEGEFKFENRKHSTLWVSMFALHKTFGYTWLESLVDGSNTEINKYAEVEHIGFTQLEPYQIGIGLTEETIYKCPDRNPEDPQHRIAGFKWHHLR